MASVDGCVETVRQAIVAGGKKRKVAAMAVAEPLARLPLSARAAVAEQYAVSQGRTLASELEKAKQPSNVRALLAALATPWPVYDADAAHKAMDGFGTDEAALVDLLAARPHSHVSADLPAAYAAKHGNALRDDVGSEMGGMTGHLLAYLLDPHRMAGEDTAVPAADAARIYAAMEAGKSVEAVLVDVAGHRSSEFMASVAFEYAKLGPTELEDDIINAVGDNDLGGPSAYPRLLPWAHPTTLRLADKYVSLFDRKRSTVVGLVESATKGDARAVASLLCDGRPLTPRPAPVFDTGEGEGEAESEGNAEDWDVDAAEAEGEDAGWMDAGFAEAEAAGYGEDDTADYGHNLEAEGEDEAADVWADEWLLAGAAEGEAEAAANADAHTDGPDTDLDGGVGPYDSDAHDASDDELRASQLDDTRDGAAGSADEPHADFLRQLADTNDNNSNSNGNNTDS
ncbi:annexin A1 [Thecamonas trahens ATCC 50062]|uniref:Annexin A1 n=1 Tax=Thecamonas trahens ATCC 50062 TaxID=461836 RepID=A0A0L0DLE5_THETB|nr:annexin A1 [Thecamonas trahens ATCC 50062]KNC52866.1 annexin A1 [Thecamonas trahens ATCC 50062]|eukprot:XP_013754966.1 annexin A1 [Thecamonas trahens ATCC 50062]